MMRLLRDLGRRSDENEISCYTTFYYFNVYFWFYLVFLMVCFNLESEKIMGVSTGAVVALNHF